MFTLPDNPYLYLGGNASPRFPRVRQFITRLFNIALAGLAAFTIVGSIGCAIKLTLLR